MLEYLPPYQERAITIDGYEVPMVEAREVNEGRECNIFLDRRFGATIPAEYSQQVLWLLANALAIGAGYSCHGENSQIANPFKVRLVEIDTVTAAPPAAGSQEG